VAIVSEHAEALPRQSGLVERLRLVFFHSFFRLLVLVVAVAEWTCVAWALGLLGVEPPLAAHALAPIAIFLFNRRVLRPQRPRTSRVAKTLLRGYVAFAFTSVFAALFLLAATVAWAAAAALATLLPASVVPPLRGAYGFVVHAGVATIFGLFAFGYVVGARALAVTRVRVALPGLPAPLAGLRIVHLSDLHIGDYLDPRELTRHVERVNALAPDLICITGDVVDRAHTCAVGFPVLAGLRARHGVFVTLGNHDFYAGADTVTAALRRLTDFTVLRDARVDLHIDGAGLTLLGVDDLGRDWARGVLEHPALPPLATHLGSAPAILLSHRPDCFRQAARLGVSLMLSGHTHGGQLGLPAWPGSRARNLAQFITEFGRGLYRVGDATLYVNRGLGFTGQKIRLFTPREIACIELEPA
jgi:hypothetical protein